MSGIWKTIKNIPFMRRLLLRAGLRYIDVEDIRRVGGVCGENVHIFTKRIDLKHGYLIQIGNNVTISDCRILAHDASTKHGLGYSKIGRISIGDNVFIGAEAIILPNVKIGNNVIVGAGAIVSKDIPDDSVVVGSPARVICSYHEYIERNRALLDSQNKTYKSVNKSKEEILLMQKELMGGGFGFDL